MNTYTCIYTYIYVCIHISICACVNMRTEIMCVCSRPLSTIDTNTIEEMPLFISICALDKYVCVHVCVCVSVCPRWCLHLRLRPCWSVPACMPRRLLICSSASGLLLMSTCTTYAHNCILSYSCIAIFKCTYLRPVMCVCVCACESV